MADIATISLKADTSDLERGTQKLKELGDTAEKVDNSARNLSNQFNRGIDSQKKASEAAKRHKKELDDLLDSINPTNKAFQTLDEWQTKLANASKKGLLSSDQFVDYNKILEQTRDKLTRVQMSLTTEGQALLAQETATNRAKKAADDFLNSLKNQTETIGKTRTELLEMKAAQMGISQQAAPLIAKLKEQEKAFMNGSITIGQYKQAMRQLPMQMTDIVTSLASGMPVWMVAIQQGGQIKDSFGGIGNSLKAMLSIITPAKIALSALAGGAIALSIAAYKGSQEFGEYNRQLILTGGYAGKTAGQLQFLSKQLSGNGITQHSMADALAKVVGAGSFSGSSVEMISNVAAKMEKSVGQSIDETIKQFQRIKDDPVKAINDLDKSLHFLTASQLEQITTLEQQGKSTDAAKLAMEIYSNAMSERADQIKENLGSLERSWEGVKNMASSAWDAMLDIGRESSLKEQIAEVEKQLRIFENSPVAPKYKIEGLRKELEQLRQKDYEQQRDFGLEKWFKDQEEIGKRKFRDEQHLKKEYEDLEEKHQRKIIEIKNSYASQSVKDLSIQRENERYEKEQARGKGKPPTYHPDYGTRTDESANQALLSLQSQLKVLREHKTVADIISSERKKLWDMEAKIAILEEAKKTRTLDKDEHSLLLRKESILASQRELALYGDKVSIQKKLNDELDKQRQRTDEIRARGEALIKTAGLSSRLQQREIAFSSKKTLQDIKDLEEYYGKEDSIRANWEAGVKRGFAEFQDQATDVYGNVSQITQSAFQGMSNTVADFFLTAKFNVTDFTKTFLEMTTKMIVQMTILSSMRAGLGGTTFGNFLGLSKFDTGGYTGDGGKYEPKGVVHGGEFVFTREATQRLGIANLYRLMESGKKGYASGGYVGGSAPMSVTQPTAFIARNPQIAGGGNVQVNFGAINIENGQQQQPSSNQANSSSLKRELRQMVESGVNNLLRNPASVLSRTIKGN